ncbi:ATP-dependent Clp protease ATP-binding subunit [Taibaiella koreensis]|uniref:ATP-dependent Clp protease ATP-binding subunit n=1 Tax=Taibaiella koreensis TaxID=1268548 RepID=UPI000E59EE82|nr:ATP-dependent Clp protease ATP-binding subunit [Taibaiella koreensis]
MNSVYINEGVHAVFHIAKAFARENYNEKFGAPHLLRALMHKDSGLTGFLESTGKDVAYLRDWAEIRIDEYPKTSVLPDDPAPDDAIDAVLEEADDIRLKFGYDEVSALCLLAALVKPRIGFSPEQLKSLPLREADFMSLYHVSTGVPGIPSPGAGLPQHDGTITGTTNIRQYCKDKTQMAREGKLDPIIGREGETRQMIEILGRRSKPNVIIAGEPGVGKTALLDGFALAIVNQQVPLHLQQAVLLELDLGALMAGASYKGEVEDRVKKIIAELKQFDKAILFVDEMHVMLDAKGPMGSGVGNLLKPELARGEITVIGATTLDEYRKIIEPEQAFNRRFELLQIAEPDLQASEKMVKLLVPHYESHHQVSVQPAAIPECVRLAKRYIKDKRLPDAALDLLDRTMAAIRMMDETSEQELATAEIQYDELKHDDQLSEKDKLAELVWFHRMLKSRMSPILLGALIDETEVEKIDTVADFIAYLDRMLQGLKELSLQKKESVGPLEVAAVVASKTNIPIGKIQTQEREKLLNMEDYLKRRMVGQEHALKVISEAIVESRSGINKAGQPIGSFFLLGPTGTGKTELAKSIAELLFNDEKAMIRFDMSEFKEEHSAALLYGAPPGYVGYEEGGMLVNKIRQQPYSVVLFDEIEKAHQSVFDVFLQIMDEGHIHDKLGKEGDFSNALILFTSNIGSDFIIDRFNEGKIPASNELMERMSGKFRPEFLARITEIIPFGPITEEMAVQIFSIQLRSLEEVLRKKNIQLVIGDDTRKMLALSGFTPKYGARQIGGTIRQQIRRPISRMIVGGEVKAGNTLRLSHDEAQQLVWQVD